ncbi:MAG: hypothetical protein Q7S77_00750 [Candidatus Staskawiczbacteria bacterium]|nr:hypothetical protein [Candidatus Staskawiczbacteria bacterium]
MKNTISNQIFSHLEFLGYKVEDLSGDKEVDLLIGRSEKRSNLILNITKNNTVIITAKYNISDSNKIITQEFLNKINAVNSKSNFTKWYYEESNEKKVVLVIETFTIDYNKQVFGTVVDALENEIQVYLKDFQEYSKK